MIHDLCKYEGKNMWLAETLNSIIGFSTILPSPHSLGHTLQPCSDASRSHTHSGVSEGSPKPLIVIRLFKASLRWAWHPHPDDPLMQPSPQHHPATFIT
jgi:hypothetical protein